MGAALACANPQSHRDAQTRIVATGVTHPEEHPPGDQKVDLDVEHDEEQRRAEPPGNAEEIHR
jgi:hypothetical protein